MSFRVFGFPVVVRPMFFAVALLLALPRSFAQDELARAASWVVVISVSILVHELGHAFSMRAFGRTPHIELVGMGGETHWGDGPEIVWWQRALVALAGPFAGFVIALVTIVFFGPLSALRPGPGTLGAEIVAQVLLVNLGWGLFNLLPMLPLDGSHVLEALAGRALGPRVAPSMVRWVSIGTALAVLALALAGRSLWIAMIAGFSLRAAWTYEPRSPAIPARLPLPAELDASLEQAWALLWSGQTDAVRETMTPWLGRLPDDDANADARSRVFELLAWADLEDGDDTRAIVTARRMRAYRPSPLLAARLEVAAGHTLEGLDALEALLFAGGPLEALVLTSACLHAERVDRLVSALQSPRAPALPSETWITLTAAVFYAEHHAEALVLCELAFARTARATHAYNAACALAHLGRVDEAFGWLERAASSRLPGEPPLHPETDPDLASLRQDPRFEALVARLADSARSGQ